MTWGVDGSLDQGVVFETLHGTDLAREFQSLSEVLKDRWKYPKIAVGVVFVLIAQIAGCKVLGHAQLHSLS